MLFTVCVLPLIWESQCNQRVLTKWRAYSPNACRMSSFVLWCFTWSWVWVIPCCSHSQMQFTAMQCNLPIMAWWTQVIWGKSSWDVMMMVALGTVAAKGPSTVWCATICVCQATWHTWHTLCQACGRQKPGIYQAFACKAWPQKREPVINDQLWLENRLGSSGKISLVTNLPAVWDDETGATSFLYSCEFFLFSLFTL